MVYTEIGDRKVEWSSADAASAVNKNEGEKHMERKKTETNIRKKQRKPVSCIAVHRLSGSVHANNSDMEVTKEELKWKKRR